MSVKAKDLRKDFTILFNKQKRKEESAQFQNSKEIFFEQRQYRKLKLKPKKPLNSLSPLFQDPDLLVEITGGNIQFLTGRSHLSRRRNMLDSVTTTIRPQAKDVSSKRVHDDADLSVTNSFEEGYYYNPKGPKKRVYIAEATTTTDSPSAGPDSSAVSTPSSSTGGARREESTSQMVYTVAPRLSELALPTHSIITHQEDEDRDRIEDTDNQMDDEDENPVLKLGSFLNSTAELLRNSTLKTIKYGGLHRLLPRLTPIKQYQNTNQQYNNSSLECQPQDDTVLTITIFSEIDKNTRMQEIEVLGSQSLRQLRKAIICPFGYGRNYHHYFQNLHQHQSEGHNDDMDDTNDDVAQNLNGAHNGDIDTDNAQHVPEDGPQELNDKNSQGRDNEDTHNQGDGDSQEEKTEEEEDNQERDDGEVNQENENGEDNHENEHEDGQSQKQSQENEFDFHTLFSADDNSIFFIENTFYTDSKHPRLSEKIITEWLSGKSQKQCKDFPINKKGIRLENLGFELNKPYCFIHYGKCEHMLVVNDVRLLSPVDNVKELPRTLSSLKYTRYKCSMCSVFPATHLTTNDILTGFSPCHFCSVCYQSFHANIQNETHVDGFDSRLYYGDIS